MTSYTQPAPDPFTVLENLDAVLVKVSRCHAAGLAWAGLSVPLEVVYTSNPANPAAYIGPPRIGDHRAMRDDLNGLRRLLSGVAASMRYTGKHDPVLLSIAEGILMARGAMAARDTRAQMHGEILCRLRRFRRDVVRRLDAIGSVDIRLDAWATVGDVHRVGVRAYLEDVLQQQADYASFGRGNLGRLVEARRSFDEAAERIEALSRGERCERRRTESGPITLARLSEQTPPTMADGAADAAGAARGH